MLRKGKYFLFSSTLVILGISACLKKEVKKLPEDVLNKLGRVLNSPYILKDKELSVALRICFSLRGYRMRAHYGPPNQKEMVNIVKKDCQDNFKKTLTKMTYTFEGNRPVLKLKKQKARGLASVAPSSDNRFKMETEKHGDLGELCQEIMKGSKAPNQMDRKKGEKVQLSFFKGGPTDKIIKLRSVAGVVEKVEVYEIGTDNQDKASLGRVIQKSKRVRCSSNKRTYSEITKSISLKSEGSSTE
jgi:hypothetical protein